jgi:hypothetical protein
VIELVDVLRPVWGETAEGPVVTGYAVQQAEVRCCVAPASQLAADDDEAPATPLKF